MLSFWTSNYNIDRQYFSIYFDNLMLSTKFLITYNFFLTVIIFLIKLHLCLSYKRNNLTKVQVVCKSLCFRNKNFHNNITLKNQKKFIKMKKFDYCEFVNFYRNDKLL